MDKFCVLSRSKICNVPKSKIFMPTKKIFLNIVFTAANWLAATVPKYDDLNHAKPVAVDATNGLKSCLFMVKCRLIILSFMAWTTEKFQFCCWLFKETPVLSSPSHSKDRAN